MYEFVDRPITSLDHGGRFLVWTLRNWVEALAAGQCPAAAVGPAFAKWNMMEAFPPFHRLLSVVNAHGLQTIAIAPVECSAVSEHEAIFLALVSNLHIRRAETVRDTIALLVEESHVGTMLDALMTLGHAMMNAGISPSPPSAANKSSSRRA